MKIEQTCNTSGKTFDAIPVGMVFGYSFPEVRFLKANDASGKTVGINLSTNIISSGSAFPIGPLSNYKEYPNARVVLE